MYLTAVRTEGLRDAARLDALDRTVQLPGGRVGAGFADGLELMCAALVPSRLPTVLASLGLASAPAAVEVEVDGGLAAAVTWDRPTEAEALLVPGERRLAVEATWLADPPFFGRLREHSTRDPRLVAALGESPRVSVRVGFMVHPGGSGAHVGLLALGVGDTSFPVSGTERPSWAAAVLGEVGRRFCRVRHGRTAAAVAADLTRALRGPDPTQRARAKQAFKALSRAPFGLDDVDVVLTDEGLSPTIDADLFRLARLGPGAAHALELVYAVYVVQPDVLLVDAPGAGFPRPDRVTRWLAARTHGTGATLEQVLTWTGTP